MMKYLLHSLIFGHYKNTRDRHMVGLFEHEANRSTDICRLNKSFNAEQVLGMNREVIL
jgi:hypothetical protein